MTLRAGELIQAVALCPSPVLMLSDRLQVVSVHAQSAATEMVQFQAGQQDVSGEDDKRETMSDPPDPFTLGCDPTEPAVRGAGVPTILCSCPQDARRSVEHKIVANLGLGPETFDHVLGVSHVTSLRVQNDAARCSGGICQ